MRLASGNLLSKSEMDFFAPASHLTAHTEERKAHWTATTTLVDLEDEGILNNTAAMDKVSSDLRSLEIMRLSDLNPDQIRLVAGSADFQTLHLRNVEIGGTIKAFHRWFKDHAPLVDAMRNIMRPARGSHKRTKVTIDGVEQQTTWGEYCKSVYGVSHDYINRLLKGEHTRESAELESVDVEVAESTDGLEQTVQKKLSAKDQKILHLEKQNEKLEEGIRSLEGNLEKARAEFMLRLADKKHDAQQGQEQREVGAHDAKVTTLQSAYNPQSGFEQVLQYFRQVRDPGNFLADLDTVIVQCGMADRVEVLMVEEP